MTDTNKSTDFIADGVKNIMLAGIGALAITADKSKELVDKLVKEGEITIGQGRVLNEELRRTVSNHVNQGSAKTTEFIESMTTMAEDDLAAVRAKLDEIEKERAQQQDADSEKTAD
ncbi:MAG: hypothetical protein SOV74_06900 [Coriobacteriales bacterium]|nr:hypothetical protein [Coriobacteriales bacterium]